MTVGPASLAAVAVRPDQFPAGGLPEFAFAGKSNVGKSSLLNCMANRKALARTSAAPGKTRTINFYQIEDRCLFVDLPGYGYAKVSKSESQKWGKMVESYLLGRDPLLGVLMLVDIRHEPSALDKQMHIWLKHFAFDITVVATKSDKISRAALLRHLSVIRKALEMEKDQVILPFSSQTRDGADRLWAHLNEKIAASGLHS